MELLYPEEGGSPHLLSSIVSKTGEYLPPKIILPRKSKIEPHISLSHELAHVKLGHGETALRFPGSIEERDEELAATALTVFQLVGAGEWTRQARADLIYSLGSYTSPRQAEEFVDETAMIAKKRLGGEDA